jgi:hypothetical protein
MNTVHKYSIHVRDSTPLHISPSADGPPRGLPYGFIRCAAREEAGTLALAFRTIPIPGDIDEHP